MTQRGAALRRVALRRPGRAGLVIALALIAAIGLGSWLASQRLASQRAAREAFPMATGQLRVDGLRERVSIDRDARGIPHILATNERDAWFGLGFAHAQDRLAQMLWLRRIALGRTAERIGEAGLETDRLVRTLGLPKLADREWQDLESDSVELLEAYTQGVNARMARIRAGRVAPPEALVGEEAPPAPSLMPGAPGTILDEDPWRPTDSLAIGKLVAWGAGASLERAVVLSDLIERLGSMGARPFFPGSEEDLGLAVPLDDPDETPSTSPEEEHREPLIRLASFRGSAWALPGRFSASGAPILVAELSVGPTAPSLLHEAHLRGGSLDVAGVAIPGLPLLLVGRNPDLAWAIAPLPVAAVDLFKESLRHGTAGSADPEAGEPLAQAPADPDRAALLYQNGSRWVPVKERFEEISIGRPGSPDHRVERLRVRETRHGPLINGLLDDGVSRTPLSLAWTGARAGDSLVGLVRLAHAQTASDVRAALALHRDPPLEVVYATRTGEVGLQVAGWIPQRTLPSGLAPVPGRLRAFDWRAGIEPDALPHVEVGREDSGSGPLRGWVVSTGSRLEEELSGVQIEWLWRSYARGFRLRQLLADLVSGRRVELRAAAEVQNDVSANVDPQLLAALLLLAGSPPELSPEGQEVADLLRSWDGMATADSRGAVAFQLLVGHLLEEILEPTIGRDLMDRYLALPGVDPTALVQNIVLGAVRSGREGGWTDPQIVGAAVRESLRRTWMSLSYRLGHNRERWAWGRLHTLAFRPFENLDSEAPPVSRSLGPMPMAGQAASLARSVPDRETFSSRRASTYRMAVDLAAPDRMLTMLSPGQSEHRGHPHFDDGIPAWREGHPSLLVTSPFLLEEAAVERLVLEPSR